jgi:prefoldin subunit 5
MQQDVYIMADEISLAEIAKQVNNLEKNFELLCNQVSTIALFLKEHQKLHERILPMDSELTEDDITNMVGAPFLNRKE